MARKQRRKLKPPVLGRLVWAWLFSVGAFAGLVGVMAHALTSDDGVGRIALRVDRVETLAAASPPSSERLASSTVRGLRLGAPRLRDGGDDPKSVDGPEADDILDYPGEFPTTAKVIPIPEPDETEGDEVIITIAGGPAATSPSNASLETLTRTSVTPIADPDPALLRATPLGKVPKIGADGRAPVDFYAARFDAPRNQPRISIVLGGLGLNESLTERAIDELPPAISLSFAPYARNLDFWTQKARQAGHEVLIELPMEGYGDRNNALGAAGLLTERSPTENLQRLDWLMARFGGYAAATNYMGAKFSTDRAAIEPVLQQLAAAGVGYLDDTGAAGAAAAQTGVRHAVVTRMIPPGTDAAARERIKRELALLEAVAMKDGVAVGKTYAYATTIDELTAWAKTLGDKDIAIAPATAVMKRRYASR